MERLKRLLGLFVDGGSIDDGWKISGFSSLEEAKRALEDLAASTVDPARFHDAGSEAPQHSGPKAGAAGARRVIVNVDGASRGNPGPSAVAAVAYLPSGELLTSSSRGIGEATNNVAEYHAVIEGLNLARRLKSREVLLRLDSELVAKQLSGKYRIKNAELQRLAEKVIRIASGFDSCRYEQIPRENNREADRLANRTLDRT